MCTLEDRADIAMPESDWLKTAETWLNKIFSSLTFILLLALCCVVLLQVTARFLLPTSPAWTEELSRYLFIYIVALGIGVAYQQGELVNVELFQHRLKTFHRNLYRLFISLITLAFCVLMFKPTLAFTAIGEYQTSPTLFINMSLMFVSTLVLFANLFCYVLLDAIRCIRALLAERS